MRIGMANGHWLFNHLPLKSPTCIGISNTVCICVCIEACKHRRMRCSWFSSTQKSVEAAAAATACAVPFSELFIYTYTQSSSMNGFV